ncbi:MAG: tRNA (5-methylaminomethyl-2-thiouridylate)-methyltransferase [Gammaproteobacteria bacterium]|nr:tRNA (5-methylaminomethyl-2-thiouridylate)-methyltransferase [Gammaproteobacteria bacterium]MDH5593881.1 tRNA (5-methylaminomethyl-2-thiouridylate)-methyltransferase [Gammaproteobacteria bacterium]
MTQQHKAVALVSGGLDSMLAVKVIQEQGIHVEGINFFTGFCVEGHTHAIRKKDRVKPKRNNALWVAEQLGIKLHIIDVIEEYKDILLNPKYGYGANLNPCLDCKKFMVHKAVEWIQKKGFDFIITGEVMGQRPMSQRKDTMPVVAKESGADDLLLRPLCAKLLPETKPEREGWIKRENMYDFSGRSRKPQMALAQKFGFTDYAQPAGGCCFLTDASYSAKLTDLWKARGDRNYELDDVMLLKVGRHIRPAENFKLIIGREEGENNFLSGYKKQFINMHTVSHRGPLLLVDGTPEKKDLELAAQILARYSQGRDADEVTIEMTDQGGVTTSMVVKPIAMESIPEKWHV